MALSLPISLTTVRDFFGSSSNNLTALHRGENNVINVSGTYGSSTTGLGSTMESIFGSGYATSGSIASGSAYLNAGNNRPHAFYTYGGVCPSLSSANSAIADSGSIDLTDYVGAYRKVNPTAGSISGSYSGTQRYWFSGTPTAYAGFYGGNYAQINGYLGTSDVSNYCQLITVQSNPYSNVAGTVTCTFTLSHAGIYTVDTSVTGNAGSGHYFSLSGTGASLKTHVGVSVSGNITLNAGLPTGYQRFFELTHTDTSATLTLTCGGTGGATFAQIRTNTNYLRHVNTNNTTKYNDMMTQS